MAGLAGPPGLLAHLDALIEYLTGSHRRAAPALVVFALLCFLPGFGALPPMDRDESRFAQASKQMLETGDFIDIRLQEQVRHKKPVGIYWLQAASVTAAERLGIANARTRISVYRIPSLIGALGAVLLTYWAALGFVGRRYAFFAGLMMAGSFLLGVEARLAKTDAMLCLAAVATFGALGRAYLGAALSTARASWATAAIFWTALAGSILLKGPVVPLLVALTILALMVADRSVRWLLDLRPLPGIAWLLVLVLPWFIAVTLRTQGEFFEQSLGGDLFGKLLQGQEGHGAPPGYYFALFWFTFWPAAVLAPLAVPFVWRARAEPSVRFLLAWLLPGWLMFELVVTKLPHYVLPLYPAAAILIALALERNVAVDRPTRLAGGLWPLVAIGILFVGIALAIVVGGRLVLSFWPLAFASIMLAALALGLLIAGGAERALTLALLAAVATQATAFTVLPRVDAAFVAPALAAAARNMPCRNQLAASAGFHEPSLVFLVGTPTVLTNGVGAADFLRLGGCRVAFVERGEAIRFDARARETGLLYARIGEVRGFNYSNGRRIAILVLARKDAE